MKKKLQLLLLTLILLLAVPATVHAATLKAPKPAVRQINNYLQVSWSKVPGAQGYVIYTKNSQSASWKKVKTVSAGTVKYNYKTVTSGKRYYFTVRAYRKTGGKIVYGAYSKTGVSCYYLTKPSLRISEKTHKSVTLSWNKVPGATGYKVIRNDSVIADTKELKYTDSVEPNTKYTYTVRAYKGTSYVDSSVVNVTTPKIPVNEAIETKVYEGKPRKFVEFYNRTNLIYYNIKAQIEFFDSNNILVYRTPYTISIDSIKSKEKHYEAIFIANNLKYSHYKIIITNDESNIKNRNFVRIGDIQNNRETSYFELENTYSKTLRAYYEIYYLKNQVPVYFESMDNLLYVGDVYTQNIRNNIDYDEIKVQISDVIIIE